MYIYHFLIPVNGNEILQKLEKHIEYFSCKGRVVICGDFNARVGDNNDFLAKEDEPYLSMPHDGLYEFILLSMSDHCLSFYFSHDRKNVNQYGKWIVDLCIDNQM